MKPSNSPSRQPRAYQKHGLTTLKAAVKGLGGRVIDRRTTLGKALATWRAELVRDLGGAETTSTQQAAIVDLAVRTKLMLDSIDTWILTQPSLVNARKRSLLPVVRESGSSSRMPSRGCSASSGLSGGRSRVRRSRRSCPAGAGRKPARGCSVWPLHAGLWRATMRPARHECLR
jgi:hypothetical protein